MRTFTSIIVILLITLTSFNQDSRDTALVNQYEGMYVFSESKPLTRYQFLGTVDTRKVIFADPQYQYIRDYLVKEAKKKYPNADGIILRLSAGDRDRADVVKFKW